MKAKQLILQKWLNAPDGYNLDVNATHIKVLHAFQMLCPGCVYHGIPQTVELFERFKNLPIEVAGIHTVFEHHHAMTPEALEVFIKEWRLPFPVAIDQHVDGKSLPETMRIYNMQGTPTTIIIDHLGEVRVQHFGILDTEKVFNFVLELTKQIPTAKKA